MFDNNFGKCGPIFNFFHQVIRKEILYVYHKNLHLTLQYVATLPCKSQKSNNVDFDSTFCWYATVTLRLSKL